ncbi:hypothetical protein [Asticcacaulis sp.]|uniref:hypothetical protein n=1 Tax=Asticcacaulis sp. TaxID=1872648 RepID=UPI00391C8CE3
MAAPLTPEQRRAHLRAYADRMLRAQTAMDAPETPDEVAKGIRTALMIERLYARCDASEAQAHRHPIAAVDNQKLQNTPDEPGHWLDRDPVGELKAQIERMRAATRARTQPHPEAKPQPASVPPVEAKREPRMPKPPKPPSRPLTPQEAALRERVLNTVAIPRPQDALLAYHDFGLIHDEDVEIIHGDRLSAFYARGETRETNLKGLKQFSRADLNLLWPDLFPLDTG